MLQVIQKGWVGRSGVYGLYMCTRVGRKKRENREEEEEWGWINSEVQRL